MRHCDAGRKYGCNCGLQAARKEQVRKFVEESEKKALREEMRRQRAAAAEQRRQAEEAKTAQEALAKVLFA